MRCISYIQFRGLGSLLGSCHVSEELTEMTLSQRKSFDHRFGSSNRQPVSPSHVFSSSTRAKSPENGNGALGTPSERSSNGEVANQVPLSSPPVMHLSKRDPPSPSMDAASLAGEKLFKRMDEARIPLLQGQPQPGIEARKSIRYICSVLVNFASQLCDIVK